MGWLRANLIVQELRLFFLRRACFEVSRYDVHRIGVFPRLLPGLPRGPLRLRHSFVLTLWHGHWQAA